MLVSKYNMELTVYVLDAESEFFAGPEAKEVRKHGLCSQEQTMRQRQRGGHDF